MRKKALLAGLLALLLLIAPAAGGSLSSEAAAQAGIGIWVNGKELQAKTPALIENGRALVPLREIAEALGATVGYETADGAKSAILKRGERTAMLTIGSAVMTAGGKPVKLEVAPRLLGDVMIVPLRALSEALGTIVAWDGVKRVVTINNPEELPVIGSAEKLKELMQSAAALGNISYGYGPEVLEKAEEVATADNASDGGAAAPSPALAGEGGDYSQTNVQVEGVDEADYAKTDGRFIYQISGSQVFVVSIADPAKPKLAERLDFANEQGFVPQELYADGERLIVIGQNGSLGISPLVDGQIDMPAEAPAGESSPAADIAETPPPPADKRAIVPPYSVRNLVTTFVYEVSDSGSLKQVRRTEQEGSYVDSRKIGSALYVITNKHNYIYNFTNDGGPLDSATVQSYEPIYRDSIVSGDRQALPLQAIRYFPDSPMSSMLLIGSLDLDRPEQHMQLSAYLGASQTVYASDKHLYAAIERYDHSGDTYEQLTQIYKFRLDQGQIVYVGQGSVPGAALNQFSMDEHNGYFRIAVTKGDMWASGEAGSTNNLYVLDEKLAVVGKLEGLAPGERIYSVRFMGNRAYMVTFRNVDPLFAIDLRNPAKPSVLGQLKIPGYSDYLHPYDENHLIGFGKETIVLSSGGTGTDSTTAYYQGMKIALFDVSDVAKPKEKFKEIIGDRGTSSELLTDHKALLFSKDKGLMAFPVQLHEIKNKETPDNGALPAYGDFVYQGAYVYKVDLKEGFKLRGRITHLSDDDLLKSGQYGFDYRKAVKRILYAGDTLYTLSDYMLKANSMDGLKQRGALTYP